MKWGALLSLLLCCTFTQADEQGVGVVAQGRLQLKGGAMVVGVSPPPASIQRVLIILHGRLRNAQTYLHSAEKAAAHAGQLTTTLIIAPQFLNEHDVARHQLPNDLLRWQGNDWMAGGLSTGPKAVSSFQVIDDIVARVSDRQQFPEVKEIVIAGHSGGAQVAQRYALLARGQTRIAPRFVIANPSSYAYFDAQRPMAFDPAGCPGFNHWKYGLQNLPAYAAGQPPAQLEDNYIKRDIVYLLGQQDIDPEHPALDKGCEAQTQGPYRLLRGQFFFDYLTRRHPEGLSQRLIEVPGVGHNGDGMFNSAEGQKALFGQ
ncbi:alpha/beta hydrolase [Pseudomonas sp. FP1154]|jgi:pimeloyl-ACP methyl ester carboxylesterase|uniref:alpha/beta hydrolase n=1 Tax=unclassified Pseudomonas TaxID=196821 RepID=UPI00156334B6|nr:MULTISPECIES: alpha/beta hydrolase [unclassified Pseudomonas]MDD2034878.1 alpha/beta hydrolase [Pseudomonas sp. 39167]QKJ37891.1 alpha/beta hydrolase [Pseudomonas sp. MPDS]WLG23908.1 alpha/beta hydrolase [Pseudomonas sp. FP1154]